MGKKENNSGWEEGLWKKGVWCGEKNKTFLACLLILEYLYMISVVLMFLELNFNDLKH